ncbi:MAG: T9SS type A sorting domain-containing protein [Flavobacteriales bacterium]
MPRKLLLALSCTLALAATAQPTWRFHLAFEDGTGARDTLWLVYDTTATVGSDFSPQVDYALGEGGVNIDTSVFNVWTWNWDGDSTKTHAFPYSWFPILDGTTIDAIDWVPPITIRWDTSMFHAPYLPYDQGVFGEARMDGLYFFFNNNHPDLQAYDMLWDDSVVIADPAYLFPFSVLFEPDDGVGVHEGNRRSSAISIYPNPASHQIRIDLDEQVEMAKIIDMTGRVILSEHASSPTATIDISPLANGMYLLVVHSPQKHTYHATFQKSDQ